MATLVLRDIGELLTLCGPPVVGEDQAKLRRAEQVQKAELALGLVHDAVVIIVDGIIHFAGPSSDAPPIHLLPQPVTVQSGRGLLVTPGLCDPHTHLLWAGERSHEFDLRNLGASYQQIAKQGGGIASTVQATTIASDEALSAGLRTRLDTALQLGTTAVEVKTGYGLWPLSELRLLRLGCEAMAGHPCAVSPTFLCHVPPPEASEGEARERLVSELASVMPIARAGLAESVDVYCDVGAFTLAETERLLTAGKAAGLGLRCHAEQFTYTGAAKLAARLGALSVEHLEQLDDEGRKALARSGTIANLLPGAALSLRLPWPDAAALLADGVRIALGTDCNPGSSYTQSQPLMMSLACTQMGLSCAEAWLAVTVHAAQSIGHPHRGRLGRGARADLVLWEADHYRQICQQLGGNPARSLWVAGAQVIADGVRADLG